MFNFESKTLNIFIMGRKISETKQAKILNKLKNAVPKIKVRLDPRTIITISSMEKFAKWKKMYPQAQII